MVDRRKVGHVGLEGPVGGEVAVHRVREISLLEELDHAGDVTRKEEVVVAQVAHDRSVAAPYGGVAVDLAVVVALGQVEEAHPAVRVDELTG